MFMRPLEQNRIDLLDQSVQAMGNLSADHPIHVEEIPPRDVGEEGKKYLLLDGRHRWEVFFFYLIFNSSLGSGE